MTALSDYVSFNDRALELRYRDRPMPMERFYEAYFAGDVDIHGDIFEFLKRRDQLLENTITRGHLRWALTHFVPEALVHSKAQDRRIVRDHYDRGNDFFGWFLGERMVYSCAWFEHPSQSVEQAQDNKLRRVCEKLELAPADRLLDIGCGWGTLVKFAAERYGADVTGITLAERQAELGRSRIAAAGLSDRARIICDDYRTLTGRRFDKIVSLEMVEHVGVKNLGRFYEGVRDLLEDDGLFVLQWAGLRRGMLTRPEDLIWAMFMAKYVFPGADASLCPAPMFRALEKAGFETYSVENVSSHYALTIERWHDNWVSNRDAVVRAYGERWFRIWNLFLAWSSLIAVRGTSACFQVVLHKNVSHFDRSRWARPRGADRARSGSSLTR